MPTDLPPLSTEQQTLLLRAASDAITHGETAIRWMRRELGCSQRVAEEILGLLETWGIVSFSRRGTTRVSLIHPRYLQRIRDQLTQCGGRPPKPRPLFELQMPPLSVRQREIICLLAGGHNNREIGEWLYLSEETVKTHLHRAAGVLGAANRAHLVHISYQRNVLVVTEPWPTPALTPEQRQLLYLIAVGFTNLQIGNRVGATEVQIKRRTGRLMERMEATDRAHLVHRGYLHGLLKAGNGHVQAA